MEGIKNLFAVSELRKRVLFTLGLLAVYRVGHVITTPGINRAAIDELARQLENNLFGLYDMFSGGSLSRVDDLCAGHHALHQRVDHAAAPHRGVALSRTTLERGGARASQDHQCTRYGTVFLSIVQGFGYALFLGGPPTCLAESRSSSTRGSAFRLMTVLTFTTGTCFVMWLGEQITERGVGNGMSLIIFAGIVVNFPRAVIDRRADAIGEHRAHPPAPDLIVVMASVVAAVIFVERGHRRVTVQYAKRVVGRRMYGGSSTHIPLKVNTAGVIPVIFASSILAFPAMLLQMFQAAWADSIYQQLTPGMPVHDLLYVTAIIFFAYFYTAIVFNPDDVAENMRKYGGFVPGSARAKRTAEYIDTILARITLAGAVYLALYRHPPAVSDQRFRFGTLPVVGEWLDTNLPSLFTQGLGIPFFFGGTTLLIVVGVAMDTVQQVEAAHHASLRRLHEENQNSRAKRLDGGFESRHAGATGSGEGRAGRALREIARDPEDLDRRHVARGRQRGHRDWIAGESHHGSRRARERRCDDWIVKERLDKPDAAPGFILDGSPTVAQAKALDGLMNGRDPLIVVDIAVPTDSSIVLVTACV